MVHDAQSAQTSQKQDECNTYMQLWKQSAVLVITTMALWQLMGLGISYDEGPSPNVAPSEGGSRGNIES